MNRNAYGVAVALRTDNIPQTNGKTIWIEPPTGYNSRNVRNIILRDIFDYSPEDVIDFNNKYPEIYVISDRSKPKVWATEKQVESWKDFTTGLISVFLRNDWLTFIRNFRYEKIFTAITSAMGAIDDTEVAARVREYLEKILNSSEKERTDAFFDLLTVVSGPPLQSRQIADALTYISAQGYGENPYITFALAKAYQASGDAPDVMVLTMLAKTNQLILQRMYITPSKSKINTMDGLEAAAIYGSMRDTYGQYGIALQQTRYDWRQRFLKMTNEERSDFEPGDIIEINQPGTYSVKDPSVIDRDIDALEEKRRSQEKIEKNTKEMNPGVPKTDHRTDEYFIKPNDRLVMDDAIVRQKKRHKHGAGYQSPYKTVDTNEPVVSDIKRLKFAAPGNAIALVAEGLKYVAVHRQMMELAAYYAEREQLQKQSYAERYKVVPPRPKDVLNVIKVLQQQATKSAHKADKEKVWAAIRELNVILYDSYAFWGK